MLDFEFCSHFRRTDICVLRYFELIVMISRYLRRKLFWCSSSAGTVAVQRRLLQTEETERRITLCHCFLFPARPAEHSCKLTWTWSCWWPSSPRELQGPGKPPVLSSSEWHCSSQEEQISNRLDWKLQQHKSNQVRCETGSWSYMISVSSQWELGRISSTLPMWRPMGRLSVWMQRQCCSTPRLLRLIPAEEAVKRAQKNNAMSFFFKRCRMQAGQRARRPALQKHSPSLMARKARSATRELRKTLLHMSDEFTV